MSTPTLTPPTTTEPPVFALIGLDDETFAAVKQREQERGGTDVSGYLSAYDDLEGKCVIDHRGMTWTSVGKDCPGYWVNARGVYRHRSYLSNMIAKERH